MISNVLDIVREFDSLSKPIVSICHGPLVLLDAGILVGKKCTGYPDIKDALEEGGAEYIDNRFVREHDMLTSRFPGDLPIFMEKTLSMLKKFW